MYTKSIIGIIYIDFTWVVSARTLNDYRLFIGIVYLHGTMGSIKCLFYLHFNQFIVIALNPSDIDRN